jgi:hypothetical protein
MSFLPTIYRKARPRAVLTRRRRSGFGVLPYSYAGPDRPGVYLFPGAYAASGGYTSITKPVPAPAPFNIVPQQPWMSQPGVLLGKVVYWNGTPYQEVPGGSGNYVKTSFGMTQSTAGATKATTATTTAAAAAIPVAPSWFDESTTIAGYAIRNLYLAGAGALVAVIFVMRGRAK